MSDQTPLRVLRSSLKPKKLSLETSEDKPKLKLKSPLDTLFKKKKTKNQATQTEFDYSSSEESEKSEVLYFKTELKTKSQKMASLKLENVPVFEGVPSKLKQFADLVDIIYQIDGGSKNEKIFATAVYYLKLSESVQNKLNAKVESWEQLKTLLETNFKHDPAEAFKSISKFNLLTIGESETLSQFVVRLIEKFNSIKNNNPDEQYLWKLAEQQAVEKIKELCPKNSRFILGNPSSLEEAKFTMETKGIGQSKITKNFKTVDELARLEWKTESENSRNYLNPPAYQNYRNFRPQGSFRGNYYGNFQYNNGYNYRHPNSNNYNPNYRNNNFNNMSNQNNNFRPQFQRSSQQNFNNNRNKNFQSNNLLALEQTTAPISSPNEGGQSSHLISHEEYMEYMSFKTQKN